jgi:hypothetical protein
MIGQHGGRRGEGLGHGRGVLASTAVVMASWTLAAGAAESAPRPLTARTAVVDSAVVPAGGACRGCREGHCRTCRPGGHHAGCRDGKCHPYCPVRPQEFGFYGTQWRRWPGQGILPAAHVQDATPSRPPKSAVPKVDEESRGPRADELPAPEAAPQPPASPEPPAETASPSAEPAPPAAPQRVPAQPAPLPIETPTTSQEAAAEPEPPSSPPAKRPATDDNLFDESAIGPVPRRFVASRPAKAAAERPARPAVRPTTLTYPASVERLPQSVASDPLAVPRVPFDPAAEAARLGR